jgi:hypothetical protein
VKTKQTQQEIVIAGESIAPVEAENSLMRMIERMSSDPQCDAAKLSAMLDVKKAYEADEARKAFAVAFAAFKSEAVKLVRNRTITAGPLAGKKHADLFAAVDAVTPLLAMHGLSHSWRTTRDEPDWIEVECVVRHAQGHAESVRMGGPPDTGGAKNAIQARASTTTYLQRYTLKSICGIAEQDEDTDGVPPSGAATAAQIKEVEDEIVYTRSDRARFLKWLGITTMDEMTEADYAKAMKQLKRKARVVQP